MILFLAGEFRTGWYTGQYWQKQKYDKLYIYTNAVEHITNIGLGIDQINNITMKQVKLAFPDANISISKYEGVSTSQMYQKWKKFCENDFPDDEVICVSRPDVILFDYEFCERYNNVDRLHLSYSNKVTSWANDILFVLPFSEFKLLVNERALFNGEAYMTHETLCEYVKTCNPQNISYDMACIVRPNVSSVHIANIEYLRLVENTWWKASGR